MELKAFQAYRNPELDIAFWRTASGLEVDFVLGDMEVAIGVKGKKKVFRKDLTAMKTLQKEHQVKKAFVVSLEEEPRKLESSIWVLPWRTFLDKLWDGDIL
jgi:predicted AAA+ superfamily ATPase